MTSHLIYADDRCLLSLNGPDVVSFLQGIITNDMALLETNTSLYTALLNPQGRYVFDFFVIKGEEPHQFWIDCPKSRASDLIKMLSFYKLRADVQIKDVSAMIAVVLQPHDEHPQAALQNVAMIHTSDPRHPSLGVRSLIPIEHLDTFITTRDLVSYEQQRIQLGAPGELDLIPQKSLPLESNFDIFNALSFTKGCYLGQELTTRTKFRGETRKRLIPCHMTTPLDPLQSMDITADTLLVGSVRSIAFPHALAFVRLENCHFVDDNMIAYCQGKPIALQKPSWLLY